MCVVAESTKHRSDDTVGIIERIFLLVCPALRESGLLRTMTEHVSARVARGEPSAIRLTRNFMLVIVDERHKQTASKPNTSSMTPHHPGALTRFAIEKDCRLCRRRLPDGAVRTPSQPAFPRRHAPTKSRGSLLAGRKSGGACARQFAAFRLGRRKIWGPDGSLHNLEPGAPPIE